MSSVLHSTFKSTFRGRISCAKTTRKLLGHHSPSTYTFRCSIREFSPEDFSVERLLGSYGFMNLSSIPPGTSSFSNLNASFQMDDNVAAGYNLSDLNRMSGLEVDRGSVEIKLYRGKIIQPGSLLGTRVILKVYPGPKTGGAEADRMAANELNAHIVLQESEEEGDTSSENLSYLLGGFQTSTGEQWLVFRDSGTTTGVAYVQLAAEATARGAALGEWELLDRFEPRRPLLRRRRYITKLIRGVISGLAYAHSKGRLHQSLGPASIVLNTMEERDAQYLIPQVRDFAFSVDVSDEAVLSNFEKTQDFGFSEGLWRRARAAGAFSPLEKRAFGIADDIYAAGLLVAYLAFVPFSVPGSVDGPTLQRLFETTFRLDLRAARDYCEADENWSEAVAFLDFKDGSGWDLLQAMLNPEYNLRPTAEAVLQHPFLKEG